MEQFLLTLQKSYILVVLLVLLTIILVAIYDNIFQKEYNTDVYAYNAILVGLLSTFIVYLHTIPEPVIIEEIMKGPPNF